MIQQYTIEYTIESMSKIYNKIGKDIFTVGDQEKIDR